MKYLLILLVGWHAHAALYLKPVLNYNISMPRIDPGGSSYSSRTGIGGGGLLELHLFPVVAFEGGILVTPYGNKLEDTTLNTSLETSWNMLQIPLTVRLHMFPLVSFGGGLYWCMTLNDQAKLKGTLLGTAVDSEGTLEAAAKSDTGAVLFAGLDVPLTPTFGVVADLRYLLGLKNLTDVAGVTNKMSHLEILAGISWKL